MLFSMPSRHGPIFVSLTDNPNGNRNKWFYSRWTKKQSWRRNFVMKSLPWPPDNGTPRQESTSGGVQYAMRRRKTLRARLKGVSDIKHFLFRLSTIYTKHILSLIPQSTWFCFIFVTFAALYSTIKNYGAKRNLHSRCAPLRRQRGFIPKMWKEWCASAKNQFGFLA